MQEINSATLLIYKYHQLYCMRGIFEGYAIIDKKGDKLDEKVTNFGPAMLSFR